MSPFYNLMLIICSAPSCFPPCTLCSSCLVPAPQDVPNVPSLSPACSHHTSQLVSQDAATIQPSLPSPDLFSHPEAFISCQSCSLGLPRGQAVSWAFCSSPPGPLRLPVTPVWCPGHTCFRLAWRGEWKEGELPVGAAFVPLFLKMTIITAGCSHLQGGSSHTCFVLGVYAHMSWIFRILSQAVHGLSQVSMVFPPGSLLVPPPEHPKHPPKPGRCGTRPTWDI